MAEQNICVVVQSGAGITLDKVRFKRPVPKKQVMESMKPYGDGILMAADGDALLDEELEAAVNYTYKVVAGPLASLLLVLQKLDALEQEVSAIQSAFSIDADDFQLVRQALKIMGPVSEDKDGNILSDNTDVLEKLLGDEQFWDERYEEQQRVRYCNTVEGWVASKRFHRCVRWVNGNRETVWRKFEGLHFMLSSNNDLVAVLRNFGELFSQGAVLGVELKRKTLTRRSLRQAYMDFFLWADASFVPFVQLITDMQRGGVAIYCKRIDAVSGIELRQVVLRNMDEVEEFVSSMGAALPDDLGDDGPDGLILPQTLSGPPRKKFKQMENTESDSGEGPYGTIGAQFLENDGDVANLADLDSFQQELGEAY